MLLYDVRETSALSVATNCETEMHVANTAGRLGHAMPTAMNTRPNKNQRASTLDYDHGLPRSSPRVTSPINC